MNKGLKLIALTITGLFLAGACSSTNVKTMKDVKTMKEEGVVADTFNLRPGGSNEECLELRPGQIMKYKFTSTDMVNFNIHYHAMDGIQYPVNEEKIKEYQGSIDPASHDYYIADQEFYCLMWDNLADEPVRISFECVVK